MKTNRKIEQTDADISLSSQQSCPGKAVSWCPQMGAGCNSKCTRLGNTLCSVSSPACKCVISMACWLSAKHLCIVCIGQWHSSAAVPRASGLFKTALEQADSQQYKTSLIADTVPAEACCPDTSSWKGFLEQFSALRSSYWEDNQSYLGLFRSKMQ